MALSRLKTYAFLCIPYDMKFSREFDFADYQFLAFRRNNDVKPASEIRENKIPRKFHATRYNKRSRWLSPLWIMVEVVYLPVLFVIVDFLGSVIFLSLSARLSHLMVLEQFRLDAKQYGTSTGIWWLDVAYCQ